MTTHNNSPVKAQTKKLLSFKQMKKFICNRFHKKYFIDEFFYGSRVINDIIYNEKTHIVASFKDYLILDDLSEFLKRYYTMIESSIRLPKFFEYYETYSRIYPNYTALPESKYIYKNIHKKQKMIDLQQELEISMEKKRLIENDAKRKKREKEREKENQVFSTEVYNSIANDSSYIDILFGLCDLKMNDSVEGINKIINQIEKYETKFSFIDVASNNANSSMMGKPPLKILGKLISKHFSTLSKDNSLTSHSNNNSIFKNINIFNEIKLVNTVSNTHRKTMSSNNSKSKHLNPNNIFPLTHRCFNKSSKIKKKEQEKIKVNISNSLANKSSEADRIKNKIMSQIKTNINNTHNRNHNCLFNNKQIFNSHTNNNSINNNTNSSLKNHTTAANVVLVPQSTKNNTIANMNSKYSSIKTDRLKTDRPKSTFDFAFLNKLIGRSVTKSKSKQKGGKVSNTAATTRNTSKTKSKTIRQLHYGNLNYNSDDGVKKKSLSGNKKISVNVAGSKETKFTSPPQKGVVRGIQIKNFNRALGINDYLSPKYNLNSSSSKKSSAQTSRTARKRGIIK